ncbi:MAG: hypothetical protein OER04_19270, partial [Cyclobacteriaceae bacterium]|nr:hypothetical protein [Cyclobacteriaceae bacterium]
PCRFSFVAFFCCPHAPLFTEDSYSENSKIYSEIIVKEDISYWAALMRIIKDARTIIGLILGAVGLIKLIV